MKQAIINPGTGTVPNATEANAAANMETFVRDTGVVGATFERAAEQDYGSGRFAFKVWYMDTASVIQMPGLLLDRVRFTGAPEENIWHYPRLYVDGSSWVWKYATSQARTALTGEE